MSNEMMDLVQFVLVCCPIIEMNKSKFELPTPNSFSVKIIFVTHGRARF